MTEHFSLAKRDNNPKREYLIINKFQSKHYPSSPAETARYCREMGEEMQRLCPEGKCLAVCFAETAVGIGALAAEVLGERCFLISTTREPLPDYFSYISFEETHSHAPSHKLCRRAELRLKSFKHIFIIDDEFTTGNTVKALAQKLREESDAEISAHAFLASTESISSLGNIGVDVYSRYTYSAIKSPEFPDSFSSDQPELRRSPDITIELNALYDIRLGVLCGKYFAENTYMCETAAEKLQALLSGVKTVEIIGTEELCLPPILLGEILEKQGFSVKVHGVTRSPALPSNAANYPIKTRSVIKSLYDPERRVFLYNSEKSDLTVIMTDSPNIDSNALQLLCGACGGKKIALVRLTNEPVPTSLEKSDCRLLIKNITGKITPIPAEERGRLLRGGVHYSELLPEEYEPSAEYLSLYEKGLETWARQTALAVRSVAERLFTSTRNNTVIVSLARAGTPVGALIKRYIKQRYGVSLPHYSISIIRGRGIDKAALEYILTRHSAENLRFVDGWTGKGAITRQLAEALCDYPQIESSPAVLADPAGVCELYGTREDIFIPCSCLNSVVSGLFSRTVLRDDLISKGDFHGAAYFAELSPYDRTNEFLAAIEREFDTLPPYTPEPLTKPLGEGLAETEQIARDFDISDLNLVKPSIGEATRVLLRRIPELILLNKLGDPLTLHLEELAREKKVNIREYPLRCYKAVGIIKN